MSRIQLEISWFALLGDQFSLPYFSQIKQTLVDEKVKGIVHYPPASLIFRAMDLSPVEKTKVVILGQDPYHNPGQAHGLSFSVPMGTPPPPSLVNIYKEIHQDLGHPIPKHGNLESWAQQGVLLLNASLTVQAHAASSHAKIGWLQFTDTLISRLAQNRTGLVFLLWGSFARAKKVFIPADRNHCILEAAHPSPLSAYKGFLGCGHFSKTNAHLVQQGLTPIDWKID